jgi:hypothetical protein
MFCQIVKFRSPIVRTLGHRVLLTHSMRPMTPESWN